MADSEALRQLRDMVDAVAEEHTADENDHEDGIPNGLKKLGEMFNVNPFELREHALTRVREDLMPTMRHLALKLGGEANPTAILQWSLATAYMDGFILGAAWAQDHFNRNGDSPDEG